jgi:hypothetical protein
MTETELPLVAELADEVPTRSVSLAEAEEHYSRFRDLYDPVAQVGPQIESTSTQPEILASRTKCFGLCNTFINIGGLDLDTAADD